MNHRFEEKNGVLCLYLTGSIPGDKYYLQLRNEIVEEIENDSIKNVLINMSELTLLTSIGLEFLLFSSKTVRGLGGKLILAELSLQAKNILMVASMDKLFRVYDSEMEAIASFSN